MPHPDYTSDEAKKRIRRAFNIATTNEAESLASQLKYGDPYRIFQTLEKIEDRHEHEETIKAINKYLGKKSK